MKLKISIIISRKVRPLDKTIDILKRSFEWIFIYDNDRDSPQVSKSRNNPSTGKRLFILISNKSEDDKDTIRTIATVSLSRVINSMNSQESAISMSFIPVDVRIIGFQGWPKTDQKPKTEKC